MCQSGAYSVPANVSRDNILNRILHIGLDILFALLAFQPTYYLHFWHLYVGPLQVVQPTGMKYYPAPNVPADVYVGPL